MKVSKAIKQIKRHNETVKKAEMNRLRNGEIETIPYDYADEKAREHYHKAYQDAEDAYILTGKL